MQMRATMPATRRETLEEREEAPEVGFEEALSAPPEAEIGVATFCERVEEEDCAGATEDAEEGEAATAAVGEVSD
jgi:hypothetical protein